MMSFLQGMEMDTVLVYNQTMQASTVIWNLVPFIFCELQWKLTFLFSFLGLGQGVPTANGKSGTVKDT